MYTIRTIIIYSISHQYNLIYYCVYCLYTGEAKVVTGSVLTYHCNESSPPSPEIAMKYATKFPLQPGQ